MGERRECRRTAVLAALLLGGALGASPAADVHGQVEAAAGLPGIGVIDQIDPPAPAERVVGWAAQAAGPGESIIAVVRPGTLTISASLRGVDLGARRPDLRPITVTDTRAGNPGFSVTGQATNPRATTREPVSAISLGWRPRIISQADAQDLVLGPVVAAGNQPLVPARPSQAGLATPRTLASAPARAGTGTAVLTAALDLRLPGPPPVARYRTTLTVTAI